MGEPYKILLVSLPGKGKTYSFRNMDPETTAFINVENKPLPFKNNFKHYVVPATFGEAYQALIDFGQNDKITSIVIDSFSAYMEKVLLQARNTKKGFDIWNMNNEKAGELLDMIKRVPKHIFVTAHYEYVGVEGNEERRVKIKGKEWAGTVEKEFTIVLYADRKLVIDGDNRHVEAWFDTSLDDSSAKCPPDILGEGIFRIPNDSNEFLTAVNKFIQ